MNFLLDNPVFSKEVKIRFRRKMTRLNQVLVFGSLGCIVLFCYYEVYVNILRSGGMAMKDGWMVTLYGQAFLVWLLCPAIAANAITLEKEQQTWEMMIFTMLSPIEILVGKMAARLIPVLAMLASFLPLSLFCAALGGASPEEFIVAYLTFGIWIFFLVTVSLFMSWAFRKTSTAIAVSYLVFFFFTIGTALLSQTFPHYNVDFILMSLNPGRAVVALSEFNDLEGRRVLTIHLPFFLFTGCFLFWRMVKQFRLFSVD